MRISTLLPGIVVTGLLLASSSAAQDAAEFLDQRRSEVRSGLPDREPARVPPLCAGEIENLPTPTNGFRRTRHVGNVDG